MGDGVKWAVLTYIAAHNDLALYGRKSLTEILNVGSSDAVVHGALYDTYEGAARYVMGDAGVVREQELLPGFNSGDPGALVETARWFYARHPAERHGLVLWSHGTGWEPSEIEKVAAEARPGSPSSAKESRERAAMPGSLAIFRTTVRSLLAAEKPAERAILFDDGTGQSLDTLELGRVAKEIAGAIGQKIELLGMDACLMASAEVGYELRSAVRWLVASEELVPSHSWPYSVIFEELKKKPEQTGGELARLIVDRYVDFYIATPPPAGDVTKTALDLGRIDPLAGGVRTLTAALCADMARHAPVLWAVQHATLEKETRSRKRQRSKFDYHLWDLGAVAAGLAASQEATAEVRAAAAATRNDLAAGADAVVAARHLGEWFDETSGVSVYMLPPGRQRLSPAYAQLAFARDTNWGEMLAAYHQQLA
jgi:hypothetical protein